jgi:hypothetical protein
MTTRRTVIKSAAWSLPVIAAAVAVPLASASAPQERQVLSCTLEPNHGHGGGTGNAWWRVIYDNGQAAILDNGAVMSDRKLREACR